MTLTDTREYGLTAKQMRNEAEHKIDVFLRHGDTFMVHGYFGTGQHLYDLEKYTPQTGGVQWNSSISIINPEGALLELVKEQAANDPKRAGRLYDASGFVLELSDKYDNDEERKQAIIDGVATYMSRTSSYQPKVEDGQTPAPVQKSMWFKRRAQWAKGPSDQRMTPDDAKAQNDLFKQIPEESRPAEFVAVQEEWSKVKVFKVDENGKYTDVTAEQPLISFEAGNHVGVVLQARSGAKGVEDGKAYAQQVQLQAVVIFPDTKLFTPSARGNNDGIGLEGYGFKQAPKSSESVATQAVASEAPVAQPAPAVATSETPAQPVPVASEAPVQNLDEDDVPF